jgi:uncharacterized alkaline shock family protein YloU
MMELKNKIEKKMEAKKVDTKEFELPETLYVRDIENRVFQGIVVQCISQMEGVALLEGNLIDSLLGRSAVEGGIKGIYAEQDSKNKSISIKVEINIDYGYAIPEKAEEIQTKIVEDITRLTGLHVSNVHLIFKNVIIPGASQKNSLPEANKDKGPLTESNIEEEYSDEF